MNQNSLHWVQVNRRRTSNVLPLGSAVVRVVADLARRADPRLAEIARRLGEQVDGEFTGHCRVADIQGAQLRVLVDRANLVAPLRMRWERSLARFLEKLRLAPPVRSVRFEYGVGGLSVVANRPEQITADEIGGASRRVPRRESQRRASPGKTRTDRQL